MIPIHELEIFESLVADLLQADESSKGPSGREERPGFQAIAWSLTIFGAALASPQSSAAHLLSSAARTAAGLALWAAADATPPGGPAQRLKALQWARLREFELLHGDAWQRTPARFHAARAFSNLCAMVAARHQHFRQPEEDNRQQPKESKAPADTRTTWSLPSPSHCRCAVDCDCTSGCPCATDSAADAANYILFALIRADALEGS